MAVGVVVDVSAKCDANIDYEMTVDDLKDWEKTFGAFPEKALVVMKTGWGTKINDPSYTAKDDTGFHFPGFSVEAAQYCLDKSCVGIGIDTGSLDHGKTTTYPVHQLVLGSDKYQIENMLLTEVPAGKHRFISSPLKIIGAPEAEARVICLID